MWFSGINVESHCSALSQSALVLVSRMRSDQYPMTSTMNALTSGSAMSARKGAADALNDGSISTGMSSVPSATCDRTAAHDEEGSASRTERRSEEALEGRRTK